MPNGRALRCLATSLFRPTICPLTATLPQGCQARTSTAKGHLPALRQELRHRHLSWVKWSSRLHSIQVQNYLPHLQPFDGCGIGLQAGLPKI